MLAKDVLTEEWLADVLHDSLDMDWTTADGARAIMRALKNGLVTFPQSGGQIATALQAAVTRGAIDQITHDALPNVGDLMTTQSRARAQVRIADAILSTLSADAIRQGEGVAQFGAEMFQVIWDQFADAGYEIEIHDLIAVSAVKAGLVRVTKFDPEVHTDNTGEAEPGDRFY